MSSSSSTVAALLIILPLMFAGVHIGACLILGSLFGIYIFLGSWSPGISMLMLQTLDVGSSYTLMVIPLFVLLGTLASRATMTTDLFSAFYIWLGRVRGGIAMAAIGTCAGMASITGSSVATSAAMTKIALPEFRRYDYDERLSVGTLANGGTLSIIIPPSLTLVLYAIFAEQSVGQMLVAGMLPGLCIALSYCALIYIMCRVNPRLGPAGPAFTWRQKLAAVPGVVPFIGIILAVVAGILSGVWTPIESAAVAVVLVAIVGTLRGRLGLSDYFEAAVDAALTSGSIFLIVMGSMLFSNLLALNGAGDALTEWIIGLQLSSLLLFALLVVIYIILGMFMEVSSILALTIPLIMPVVFNIGWNPIWFGVIVVILMELAMVTPPVGLNLYAIRGVAPDVPLQTIFMGSIPFLLVTLASVFGLYAWPGLALILPNLGTY